MANAPLPGRDEHAHNDIYNGGEKMYPLGGQDSNSR